MQGRKKFDLGSFLSLLDDTPVFYYEILHSFHSNSSNICLWSSYNTRLSIRPSTREWNMLAHGKREMKEGISAATPWSIEGN